MATLMELLGHPEWDEGIDRIKETGQPGMGLQFGSLLRGIDAITGFFGGGSGDKEPEPLPEPEPEVVPVVNPGPAVTGPRSTTTAEGTLSGTLRGGDQRQDGQNRTQQGVDNAVSGQGNATLVVTPSAESNQQLESQANAENNVSQVLSTSGTAGAESAQHLTFSNAGAQQTVAPVISFDLADTFISSATSDTHDQTADAWPWVIGLGLAGVTAAFVIRPSRKSGNNSGSGRRKLWRKGNDKL